MAQHEGSFEEVRSVAKVCDSLVDDTVYGRRSVEEFGEALRRTGITNEAAGDYVQELKQRLKGRLSDQNRDSATASSSANNHSEGRPAQDDPIPLSALTPESAGRRVQTPPAGPVFGANIAPPGPPSSAEVNEEVAWALL
jgi:hypothetical protein